MTTMQKIIYQLASWDINKQDDKILCRPVYIGNVLEKCIKPKIQGLELGKKLLELWGWCGFDKSLQEIESCGYEEVNMCGACGGTGVIYQEGYKTMCAHCQLAGMGFVQKLKDPNAQALAEFINSVI